MESLSIDDNIYYLEKVSNKVYAHTKDNTYLIKTSFESIRDKLSNNFYYANPYTLVNVDKITEVNYVEGEITLENGIKIEKIAKKFNIL